MGRVDRFLSVILALSVLTTVGALLHNIAKPKIGERFTEFYLLGPTAQADAYPKEATVDESTTLIIGVINREHDDVQYRIERAESAGRELIATMQLGHEETWQQPYTFTLTEPGENQKIEFLLCKGDETEPYRSLHLWITVVEE
jgi:uncharacterized membrane protein